MNKKVAFAGAVIFFILNLWVAYCLKEGHTIYGSFFVSFIAVLIDALDMMKYFYLVISIYAMLFSTVVFYGIRSTKNLYWLLLVISIFLALTLPYLYLAKK